MIYVIIETTYYVLSYSTVDRSTGVEMRISLLATTYVHWGGGGVEGGREGGFR